MAFEKDAADITEDTNLSEELGVQSKQRIAMTASIPPGSGALPAGDPEDAL